MEMQHVTAAFAALSQETRLRTLRILARAGDDGMLSGEIGAALDVRPNTISTNLGILLAAGLIRNRREGRSVRYFVEPEGVRRLAEFLLEAGGADDEVPRGVFTGTSREAPTGGNGARAATAPGAGPGSR